MAEEDPDTSLDGDEPLPNTEPKSSKAWWNLIVQAERAFKDYHDRADNIDKQFANLERLANTGRDRQFQLFWANIQVLAPSIYSRRPIPVVVPRFKNQDPLARTSSELLERASVVTFEVDDIHSTMLLIRDDLAVSARGCAWLRYETKAESDTPTERVCIEHVDRKDFLHDPARKWSEVDWVAKRSWLTRREMRKRFRPTSGDAYKDAAFESRKDRDDAAHDERLKAGVWEIWSRSQDRVVWVSEGCDKLLDDGEPHLTLEGFFPCPKPAYATVQRRSLLPVPDFVFYKDQLEEINELTARIGALTDAVKLRGFYPAGAGEVGDAVEAAVKSQADNVVLYPISNWALMGNGAAKDMIVWLPIDMVAKVIAQLVELRKQLIDDVYQITGLSDIMRGQTEASETLGAQQLKSQYGSIRIRDRQEELVRVARDITRIASEIMAENFAGDTLLEMTQMDIPSDAEIRQQIKPLDQHLQGLKAELAKAMQDPQIKAMAQQQPDKAQQAMQQVQQQMEAIGQQIQTLDAIPTIEAVMKQLRDEKLRPFVLDIETDSTISPDEDAEKQRATEYLQAMGGLLAQGVPAVEQLPQIAPVIAATIRFAQSKFRVGRQLDQVIDEFADQMMQLAKQPKPPDPAQQQAEQDAQAQQAKLQMDQQSHQADMQIKTLDLQGRQQDAQLKAQSSQAASAALAADAQAKQAQAAHALEAQRTQAALQVTQLQQKHEQDIAKGQLELQKLAAELVLINANAKAASSASASK